MCQARQGRSLALSFLRGHLFTQKTHSRWLAEAFFICEKSENTPWFLTQGVKRGSYHCIEKRKRLSTKTKRDYASTKI
jgi:hypothetical protein